MKPSGLGWAGDIPKHWDVAKICLIAKLESGHTPSRQHPEYWVPSECTIPWFSLADVWQLREGIQEYLGDTAEKISPLGMANSAARLLPAGTVVLSRTASVGFAGIMPRPMATTQDFANWIPGDRISSEFLLYALRGMREEFRRATMGSTHQTIYMPDIRRLTVPLPPREEQDQVVRFLRVRLPKLDELIAKKERLVELLAEKRQALITQAVTKGFDPTVPMKDSGVAWLGAVPAHWSVVRLRSVTRSIETGPFGSQLHAHDYVEGGIPVINPANLVAGCIEPDRSKTVEGEVQRRLARHVVRAGDILLGRRGEMGRCAVVSVDEEGWLCGTGCMVIRLAAERCNPSFVGHVLARSGTAEWLSLNSVGSTMENLNAGIAGRIPLPLPSLEEQERIVGVVAEQTSRAEDAKKLARVQLERIREYRQALITAAVTGQLNVTTADSFTDVVDQAEVQIA